MQVSLEAFNAAVDKLRELYAEDLVGIEIAPDGSASISLRPEGSERAPEPGGGLYADIEETLTAILNGATVDEFVKARSTPRPMMLLGPDTDEIARGKYEALANAFPDLDEIRQRVWLRRTSKVPVLIEVGWEVLQREADSSDVSTSAGGGRYGLLRLGTAQSIGGFAPKQDVALLSVDLRDVRQLLDELERLRSALAGEG